MGEAVGCLREVPHLSTIGILLFNAKKYEPTQAVSFRTLGTLHYTTNRLDKIDGW